ncbi:WD repeat-containing protein [Rasamsonia emersonii CBS 393.64]|uniref:WD repeat-containing protein n=1 Tax=Rasamsonia emersonii (strain ATCC 16479 / CBS 393.64 / IMI 116815) TaxID=1408163 RepID=A0A0F4YYE6_RASE3|nr:WD repeat-containing protein [Rasamsonia emersonii CBS 393.64]KKA22866.1 WD repeat-containing protein [Rasamsonia emersonii CBS 393.64]
MKSSLYDRILRRELGDGSYYGRIPGLYGSKEWIDDLDIVNELGGHTGCVNALTWSRTGRLLASGSDDTYLNIYSYQPDSSTSPFALNTTIATGHRANIFSVKFMPHSNDQTLVCCAGDSEVRVFDVEYSARNGNIPPSESFASSARSRRMTDFFSGVRYLTTRNTNARVYRCHADRVKRIVTESSPFLFLTCSEDGEVRQWDLRQPSSAYPAPRGGQGFMAYRPGLEHDDSNVPPPLISYKRYHIDLNTISCASSQPHYIALGGAHLHCFLHDRRMMGRDLLAERGQPGGFSPIPGTSDDEQMGRATRCVRRFAPGGQKRMRPQDNGHITACKISDAYPNEMVVSWSGEHIYSFDLIRSDDAREAGEKDRDSFQRGSSSGRKRSKTRKRKREKVTSITSLDSGNRHQSRRRSEEPGSEDPEMSFRVRYGNGQSEDIPIPPLTDPASESPEDVIERARESVLNEAQKLSLRIAKGLVKLRKTLFSLEASVREATESQRYYDSTPYAASFSSALECASTYLPQMDEVIRNWRYPLNPTEDDVIFQQTLRRNRESARRFVQASGTLARFLGGRVESSLEGDSSQEDLFREIVPAPSEDGVIDPESQFGYDFLKAIILWLERGRAGLVEGFKLRQHNPRNRARFPIPDDADERAIEDILIPYFQRLAGSTPVVDIDRFEHDESRVVFESQSAAVTAFGNAVKLSLEDLGNAAAREEECEGSSEPPIVRTLNRRAAIRFWGFKVGRSILMQTGEGVNFEFVNRAFGGLRTFVEEDQDEDDGRERMQEDIDPNEEEEQVEEARLRRRRRSQRENTSSGNSSSEVDTEGDSLRRSPSGEDVEMTGAALSNEDSVDHSSEDGDEDEEMDDEDDDDDDDGGDVDDDDDDDDNDNDDDDDDEEDEGSEIGGFFIRRGHFRNRRREEVEAHVPCSSHVNVYRGHCNVKTVKDVNYFGLDDEYVVSGSDSGHVFIWERKTAKLVNILEGDGEIVNVVQGHPYEPTMAVSGIDNTIKIFSPDRRAQDEARRGINILNPDHPANLFRSRARNGGGGGDGNQVFGLRSCKRMQDSYQIIAQNDRSMLARLAATLRERHALGGGVAAVGGEGGEGATIVLDDNCNHFRGRMLQEGN